MTDLQNQHCFSSKIKKNVIKIESKIKQYEMAFRIQTSVPEVMSIDDEPQHMHDLYGTEPGKESFANNCLLARRLAENGVRFIQL